MKLDQVKREIWEEIARDLAKDRNVGYCRCYGEEFSRYLLREADLPFPLENIDDETPPGQVSDLSDLVIGWQVLEEERTTLTPEAIYRMLKAGGEALFYGFYSNPRPDDVVEWERRCRGHDGGLTIRLPLPGAVSLSRISGWLRSSPFDRYTIRKKGIYYQVWLRGNVKSFMKE